jgi:hypothetical protein
MAIADACRRHERLRFDYTSPRGGDSLRVVEPHSLVNFNRHWYLVGVVEAVDEQSCLLHVGADSPAALVWMITSADVDFTLTGGPPELVEALRVQAARCLNAI